MGHLTHIIQDRQQQIQAPVVNLLLLLNVSREGPELRTYRSNSLNSNQQLAQRHP